MISARCPARTGFTLVEMLVAASILAVIGLAVAETLRAAKDAERRMLARSERRAHDRAILDRIARDLRALMPPGGTYAAGLVGQQNVRGSGREPLSFPDEEGKAQAQADADGVPAPPFDERDQLTLSVLPGPQRFGVTAPTGWGAIQSIMWEVDDDPATPERGLVRRPTTVRDPVPGALPEPVEIVGPNVCGIAFRYFDGTTWQQTWDSSAQDLIPQAVEISVAVRSEDGEIYKLLAVVAPLAGRPSQLIEAQADSSGSSTGSSGTASSGSSKSSSGSSKQ